MVRRSFRIGTVAVLAALLCGTLAVVRSVDAATPTATATRTPMPNGSATATAAHSPSVTPVPTPTPSEPACAATGGTDETAVFGFIPAQTGTVRIPELGLEAPVVDGCFEFRRLLPPRSPMLVSFEISADSLQPSVWAHYVVLFSGETVNFSPQLHVSASPELIDPCPDLVAHPQTMSAAIQLQAQLCAELPARSFLPPTDETHVQLPNTGAAFVHRPHDAPRAASVLAALLLLGGCAMLRRGFAVTASYRGGQR